MRRGFIFLVILLAIPVRMGICQEPAVPAPVPIAAQEVLKKNTEWLKALLGLTEEQLRKSEPINTTTAQKLEEARKQPSKDNPKTVRSIRGILQERETELRRTLTSEQWRKWQSAWQEEIVRTRIDVMAVSLQLTEEQATKVEEIHRAAVRELQEAEKKYSVNKIIRIKAIKETREHRENDLQNILTPDQWKIYQETKREIVDIFAPK